jgi:CRISPR-associated protein Cmr3
MDSSTDNTDKVLQIQAVDTLFFRDGKPFTMGEDSVAEGMFPPMPSVLYGALRSAYFADNIEELDKANENDDPTEELVITGVYYLQENIYKYISEDKNIPPNISTNSKILYPVPLDLANRNGEGVIANTISFSSNSLLNENAYHDIVVEGYNGFLDSDILNNYLSDEKNGYYPVLIDSIKTKDIKIGIGRDKQLKSVKEGLLYRTELTRLHEKVNFFAEENKTQVAKTSILIKSNFQNIATYPDFIRLGGEGKIAKCDEIPIPKIKFDYLTEIKKYFKLYFLTPAVFTNKFELNKNEISGSIPDFDTFNLETLECEWKGIKLKLLSAFVGKYQTVGGFDIKRGEPKPMQKAIPAGSVYYFEIIDNKKTSKDVISEFHNKSVYTDKNSTLYKQGYGITLICNLIKADSLQ